MNTFKKIIAGVALLSATSISLATESTLVLVAGGDVEWSGKKIYVDTDIIFIDDEGQNVYEGGWWSRVRYLTRDKLIRMYEENDPLIDRFQAYMRDSIGGNSDLAVAYFKDQEVNYPAGLSREQLDLYPFEKIAPILKEADVAFVNLESPLTDDAYRVGEFKTPTSFTRGLNSAGIDVVSIANNHIMDTERDGMFDTIEALDKAGIESVGAGANLADATEPAIFEAGGVRVAFLAYTQMENSGQLAFATAKRAGVAPMEHDLIVEHIAAVKPLVDHVIVSLHWDTFHVDVSKQQELHPNAIAFAHSLIDAGADVILGHHAHVPRAVEIYKGKPIFYSLSHLIFGMSVPQWMDNYVARLAFSKKRVEQIEIIPVAGKMQELGQPYQLEGERAAAMLSNLDGHSRELNTQVQNVDGIGLVVPVQ